MDTIVVEKNKLIETLETNRAEHPGIFVKAQIVYREKVIEAFEDRLKAARNGEKIVTYVGLPEPEDHTRDFDTAIEMLRWDTGDTVELDRRDFKRFVQNNWEWQASFAANTQSYSAMLDEQAERGRDLVKFQDTPADPADYLPPRPALVLYIAGPMYGLPEKNYPAFRDAEAALRLAGYDIVTPLDADLLVPYNMPEPTREWWQRVTLRMLLDWRVDAVALLDGWENSQGAELEVTVARALNMRVKPVKEWMP